MTWTPTDEMCEAVKVAFCKCEGLDPEKLSPLPGDDYPQRDFFKAHATAALSAIAPHIAAAIDAALDQERERQAGVVYAAIMAEREAAAMRAETHLKLHQNSEDRWDRGYSAACRWIAAAIRARGQDNG